MIFQRAFKWGLGDADGFDDKKYSVQRGVRVLYGMIKTRVHRPLDSSGPVI